MKSKVELVFDNEIAAKKRVGNIQVVLGLIALLFSIGFLLTRGPNSDFAFALVVAVFMIVTGLNSKKC